MNYIIKEIFSENESKVMSGKEIISLYPDMKEKLSFNDLFNVYPNGSIDMKKSGENCIAALNSDSEIEDWIVTVFKEEILIKEIEKALKQESGIYRPDELDQLLEGIYDDIFEYEFFSPYWSSNRNFESSDDVFIEIKLYNNDDDDDDDNDDDDDDNDDDDDDDNNIIRIKIGKIHRMYKGSFSFPAGEFVIVGDVPEEQIKKTEREFLK